MCRLIHIAFMLFINIHFGKLSYVDSLMKQTKDPNETKRNLFKRNRQFNLLTDEILKRVPQDNQKEILNLLETSQPSYLKQSEDYCSSKSGGFYDDPESCENFIICFADKTFKIPCAHGTTWDHIKKQCDFSGRSDCKRKTTATSNMPSIFSTKKTTLKKMSKKFERTFTFLTTKSVKTIATMTTTENNYIMDQLNFFKIKSNILFLSIIIPAVLFIVVLILIMIWFCKRRKRLKQEKIELNSYFKNVKSHSNFKTNNLIDENSMSYFLNKHPVLKQKRCKQAKLYKNKIHDARNHSFSTTYKMNDIIKNKHNIAQLLQDKSRIINDHKLPMDNLPFNVEENNWEYNYATRGLDLNKPLASGQFIPSFVENQNTRSDFNLIDQSRSSRRFNFNPNQIHQMKRNDNSASDGYFY